MDNIRKEDKEMFPELYCVKIPEGIVHYIPEAWVKELEEYGEPYEIIHVHKYVK